MAVRKTIQIGDPRLKAKNIQIKDFGNPRVKRVIKDLRDSMIKNDLVGLAAPQIAYNFQIFVTQPRKTKFRKLSKGDKFRIYINPKIIKFSKKQNIIYEGCGSVLNGTLFGPVKRAKEIVIEAYDEKGIRFQLRCDGILARVILHEYDHMFGIEFTEKIYDYKKLMAKEFYVKNIRNSKKQLEASNITVLEVKTAIDLAHELAGSIKIPKRFKRLDADEMIAKVKEEHFREKYTKRS
jgi:peptide deformylase